SLLWLRANLDQARNYLGAAVPKVIADKVPHAATVIRSVTPTAVRFIEVPQHGPSVLLATFPRGNGMAHLGQAQSITTTLARDIYPWGPLILITWVLAAATRTLVLNRLYPSASAYIMSKRDRSSKQWLSHPLAIAPYRYALAVIAAEDAGMTLLDWVSKHGGNHGEDAGQRILALNDLRRQRGIGSITSLSTKLKAHWTILVPKTFGQPLSRDLGDGRTIAVFERMTLHGVEGSWTMAQPGSSQPGSSQPGSSQPGSSQGPADGVREPFDQSALCELPTYAGGPIPSTRRRTSRLTLTALPLPPKRKVPLTATAPETTLVFFSDPTFAQDALAQHNVHLWMLNSMFLTEELAVAAARIASRSAECTPQAAEQVAHGLSALLFHHMTSQAKAPGGQVVPVCWAGIEAHPGPGLLDRDQALRIFAHDTRVRANQLGLASGHSLSAAECIAIQALRSHPLAQPISQVCRDLPKGLPITAMVAEEKDRVRIVCARAITMRNDPLCGWSWATEPQSSCFHGPWRTGREWIITPSRLAVNSGDPHYQALCVNLDGSGQLAALVTAGGEVSLTGDLGLAERWMQFGGASPSYRRGLGANAGFSALVEITDAKLLIHKERSVPILFVRLCGDLRACSSRRVGIGTSPGVLAILEFPSDALDARALWVALRAHTSPPVDLSVEDHLAIAIAVAAPEVSLCALGALAQHRDPSTSSSPAARSRRARDRKRAKRLLSLEIARDGLLARVGSNPRDSLVVANVITDMSLDRFAAALGLDESGPTCTPFEMSALAKSEQPVLLAEIQRRLMRRSHSARAAVSER
ncbi:MAG: hypothetical protein ACYDEY_15200, partial [Acidimicrobiales bacterium]